MSHETSYDVGLKPFSHDKNRGKWASPADFLFACIGHAFKIDAMFVLPSIIFHDLGLYALIPYFFIMMVCTVPIVFMQSFLGQFSGTGFISVFRISPIFKGIGYVSLAVNVATLTYYSIFAAIPLFLFIHSLNPKLPWGCTDGNPNWAEYENFTTPCNLTKLEFEKDEYAVIELPAMDFMADHLDIITWRYESFDSSTTYSWELILCTLVVWLSVWAVLRKPTEMVGRFLRYSSLAMFAILAICFIRFICLPGAFYGLTQLLNAKYFGSQHFHAIILLPLMALSALGPGWGTILSMASFNDFKTDITKTSWIICFAQMATLLVASLCCIFTEKFLKALGTPNHFVGRARVSQWMHILSVPSALATIELPNFWCLIFFAMLVLGALNLLVVQLLSVLTSLFDEYERLRSVRKEVLQISVGVLGFCSILFCSNHGVASFEFMMNFSVTTQILLNLLLLLVVLWIYGRERLQRDIHFMINRAYPTWMVNIVRFVAPIVLLFVFLVGTLNATFESDGTVVMYIIVVAVVLLPWLLIPGYCIFKMMQTRGLLALRFRRSTRPTDWYPVDPVERHKYEETINNSEISYQLVTSQDEV